ncbi:MAG TPA: gluconolaconase, partial [Thermoanaerobaculia bacterium]|nr:gluconolaconase [Thermoanaerobaculia bacterium]
MSISSLYFTSLMRVAARLIALCSTLIVSTASSEVTRFTFARVTGSEGGIGYEDGDGALARFNRPTGVATDSAGNVYVADLDNDEVRKITPDGYTTTLAGLAGSTGKTNGVGAAASFNAPGGIAVDPQGNVYVADIGNNLIRKITQAGIVSSFAGSGFPGGGDGTG